MLILVDQLKIVIVTKKLEILKNKNKNKIPDADKYITTSELDRSAGINFD